VAAQGKIAVANHQVAVTNATGADPYKYFAMAGLRQSSVFNVKPALRFLQYSRSHKSKHLSFYTLLRVPRPRICYLWVRYFFAFPNSGRSVSA
jgi:hypothetical protein